MKVWLLSVCMRGLLADPCYQLPVKLGLQAESYIHGQVCHGLFWAEMRGMKPICAYTSHTSTKCEPRFPVTVVEATVLLQSSVRTSRSTIWSSEAYPQRQLIIATTMVPSHVPDVPKNGVPIRKSWRSGVGIVAMGDCGVSEPALKPTSDLLATAFANRDATFLLGDLFYPLGIDMNQGVNDPRLPRLVNTLTRAYDGSLFPVLGNHDWQGDWQAEISYSRLNSRWIFPHRFHFQRVAKHGVRVCAWFIDTDKRMFNEDQAVWLRSSIKAEESSCDWKVVAGHHFVVSGGEYDDNIWLKSGLVPILDEFKIPVYLAGHEHQSQVIKLKNHPTFFLIAGALGDLRDKPLRGHEGQVYINKGDVAILHLHFSRDRVEYRYIKCYEPGAGTVLFQGLIEDL